MILPVLDKKYDSDALSAPGHYHLSSGFINHNIAQKEVFYPVIIVQILITSTQPDIIHKETEGPSPHKNLHCLHGLSPHLFMTLDSEDFGCFLVHAP